MRGCTSGRLAASIMALCGCAAGAVAQTAWLNPVNGLWSDPANWTAGVPNSAGVTATLGHAGAYTVTHDASFSVGVLDIANPGAIVGLNFATSLFLNAALINAGRVFVNTTATNSTAQIILASSATFSGNGRVSLNASPANNDTARIIRSAGGITLTNAAGHTIDGVGNINSVPTDNAGTIRANVTDRTLVVFAAGGLNSGLYEATNGGILIFSSNALTQPTGGVVRADGGRVQLSSSSITGGVVRSLNGGLIENIASQSSTLIDTTLEGDLHISHASSLLLNGSFLANNAEVVVNAGAVNSTGQIIVVPAGLLLSGTGSVVLNANSNNNDSARIVRNDGNSSFTNGAGHTIRGTGNINSIPFLNAGTIAADVSGRRLIVANASATNNNLMTATNGGTLQLSSCALSQAGAGRIVADGGPVELQSSSVTGGALTAVPGSAVLNLVSQTSTLTDVTFSGALNMSHASTLQLNGSSIVNNGVITVNTDAVNSTSQLNVIADGFTLAGSGTVVLNAHSANSDTARIVRSAGGITLTNGANHTIRGTGNINSIPFVNNGAIRADVADRAIAIISLGAANNGLLAATGGGVLHLSGGAVTQGAGGSIVADGGEVQLTSSSITNGPVTAQNGGLIRNLGSQTSTLVDVSLSGPATIDHAGTLNIGGNGIVNNGVLTVNTASANSTGQIQFISSGTLSGSGTVVLNANSANTDTARIVRSAGGIDFTNGANHTIRGTGNINGIPFINNGVIRADVDGRGIASIGLSATNNNLMTTANNGILHLSSTGLTQAPGARLRADTGEVRLQSSGVAGGRLETMNGGRFRNLINQASTINAVHNTGQLDVDHAGTLNLAGGEIVNDGVITVNTDAVNSTGQLQLVENMTLNGAGRVVLNASTANLDTARIIRSAGGITLTNGTGHTIAGRGNINGCPIVNNGIMSPGTEASAGTINVISVPYTQTGSGVFAVKLGGTGAGQSDRLNVSGPVTLDGALDASTFNGYLGALDDAITILTGASITGVFSSYSYPDDPGAGARWAVHYTPTSVVLRVVCNPDFNGDGQVDFFDYLDFVQALNSEDARGDYNRDGQIDFFDYLDFVNAFAEGC